MSKCETLDEELKSLSPLLQKQPRKEHGMHTPPGYFENLEDAVFSKIDAEGVRRPTMTARTGGMLKLLRRPATWAAAAAITAIAVASWWMLQPATAIVPEAVYTEALTEEEIEEYVLDNITEFDSEQLASITAVEEPQEPVVEEHSTETAPSKAIDDISPEEMENLLQQMSEEELESLL